MATKKKKIGIVAWMDSQSLLVKILLTFWFLDAIFYGLYRISKGKVLIGVLWFIIGCLFIGTIIDIIGLVLHDGKIKILT